MVYTSPAAEEIWFEMDIEMLLHVPLDSSMPSNYSDVTSQDNIAPENENNSDVTSQDNIGPENENSQQSIEMDIEEGEVMSSEDEKIDPEMVPSGRRYDNRNGGFMTGFDISELPSTEQLKRRAERFGIKGKTKTITSEEVTKLQESLGITEKQLSGQRPHVRLNAVHMRGLDEMSTEDIFHYFQDYGPCSVEWINDTSCNVLWIEPVGAARALLGRSKPIRNANSKPPQEIVLELPDSEEELDHVDIPDDLEEYAKKMAEEEDKVDPSSITIPLPPGNWRRGVPHPNAKDLILRYATVDDKKLPGAEKRSHYYQKYGNPNFGGLRGVITESHKKRVRQKWGASQVQIDDKKNPWASLAASWAEAEKPKFNRFDDDDEPEQGEIVSSCPESDEEWQEKLKRPRMRMYADEEQEKQSSRDLRNRLNRVNRRVGPRPYRSRSSSRGRRSRSSSSVSSKDPSSRSSSKGRRSRSSSKVRRSRSSSKGQRSRSSSKGRRSRSSSKSRSRSRSSSKGPLSEAGNCDNQLTVIVDCESDSEDSSPPLERKTFDLRFKLNRKRSNQSLLKWVNDKCPLKVEIDNDAYYGLIDSDDSTN